MPSPTDAATAWVQAALATSEPLTFNTLAGGWSSDVYAVRTRDGGEAVLRQLTREPWRTHSAELLAREAASQRLLAGSDVRAPFPLAVDVTGVHAGVPSLLMTRLPGDLLLDDAGDDVLTALAGALTAIHQQTLGDADRPRCFQSWAEPGKRTCPDWSRRPDVWREAFRVLDEAEPDYTGAFLHRDFHLGNVLWQGRRVTGVVDWVETSWGPPDLDVAHCQSNLAMLHGPAAAMAFPSRYLRCGGVLDTRFAARSYWQVMDIVGFLPSPRKVAQPWRDKGRTDVTDSVTEQRLEGWLAAVLAERAQANSD